MKGRSKVDNRGNGVSAGEEVGVGNVYNSFKKYEEKQENRKTKAKEMA